MNKTELTASENMIMKVIWRHSDPISIPDLTAELEQTYGKPYARSTVVTFLTSMSNKGYVDTVRKGRLAYVFALKTEEEHRQAVAKKNSKLWFNGSVTEYIAALHKAGGLTPEDIKKARELLEELDD